MQSIHPLFLLFAAGLTLGIIWLIFSDESIAKVSFPENSPKNIQGSPMIKTTTSNANTLTVRANTRNSKYFENAAITNNSSLCLDIPGANTGSTKPILLGCHGGGNQMWSYSPDNKLMVQHSKKCLELQSDLKTILQKPCAEPETPAAFKQKWVFDDARRIRNVAYPSICLTSTQDSETAEVEASPCKFVVVHQGTVGTTVNPGDIEGKDSQGWTKNPERIFNFSPTFQQKLNLMLAKLGGTTFLEKEAHNNQSRNQHYTQIAVHDRQIWQPKYYS